MGCRLIPADRGRPALGTFSTRSPALPPASRRSARHRGARGLAPAVVSEEGGRLLRDESWGPAALIPLELARDPRVAPRAAGGFDVLVIGSRTESPSDGEERVLVTWPVRGGIEGRWVRVRGE